MGKTTTTSTQTTTTTTPAVAAATTTTTKKKPNCGVSKHLSCIQQTLCTFFSFLFSPLVPKPLLPEQLPRHAGRKTLVLDLDETLVHSSFIPIPSFDISLEVVLDGKKHTVLVKKRPALAEFLVWAAERFELVVFTASLPSYADPVIDAIDPAHHITYRLYRPSCTVVQGHYIKDLNRLGRDVYNCIIVDNSPASYALHPQHAIPISTFTDDQNDTAFEGLKSTLERVQQYDDVPYALKRIIGIMAAPPKTQAAAPVPPTVNPVAVVSD